MRPLALSLLVLLAACKGGGGSSAPPADWQPSMKASDWSQPYGQSAEVVKPIQANAGWLVYVPEGPCIQGGACPNAGYLLASVPGAIAGQSIQARLRLDLADGASLRYDTEASNTCSGKPTARLLIQRKSDDLTKPDWRWWSNPQSFDLSASGEWTITVPLVPEQWSNVSGQRSAEGLSAALANAWRVGFTLGGGCFFGHGLYAQGGVAKLTLLEYKINR